MGHSFCDWNYYVALIFLPFWFILVLIYMSIWYILSSVYEFMPSLW